MDTMLIYKVVLYCLVIFQPFLVKGFVLFSHKTYGTSINNIVNEYGKRWITFFESSSANLKDLHSMKKWIDR